VLLRRSRDGGTPPVLLAALAPPGILLSLQEFGLFLSRQQESCQTTYRSSESEQVLWNQRL